MQDTGCTQTTKLSLFTPLAQVWESLTMSSAPLVKEKKIQKHPTQHIYFKIPFHTTVNGRLWVDYMKKIKILSSQSKILQQGCRSLPNAMNNNAIWFLWAELAGAFETSFGTSIKHISVGSRNQKQQRKIIFWSRYKSIWGETPVCH